MRAAGASVVYVVLGVPLGTPVAFCRFMLDGVVGVVVRFLRSGRLSSLTLGSLVSCHETPVAQQLHGHFAVGRRPLGGLAPGQCPRLLPSGLPWMALVRVLRINLSPLSLVPFLWLSLVPFLFLLLLLPLLLLLLPLKIAEVGPRLACQEGVLHLLQSICETSLILSLPPSHHSWDSTWPAIWPSSHRYGLLAGLMTLPAEQHTLPHLTQNPCFTRSGVSLAV